MSATPNAIVTRTPRWRLYAAAGIMEFTLYMPTVSIQYYCQENFGYGVGRLSLVFGTSLLAFVIGGPIAGRLAEKTGRLAFVVAGTCVMLASRLALVLAYAPWHFFAAMAVTGVANSLFWPALEAKIAQGAATHSLRRRVGWFNLSWSTVDVASFCVGGTLAWLGNRLGYGYVFPYWLAVACSVGILGLLVIRRWGDVPRARAARAASSEDDDEQMVPDDDTKRLWLHLGWIANFIGWGSATVLRNLYSDVAESFFGWGPATWGFLATFYMIGRSTIFVALQRTHRWPYRPAFFFGMQALGVVSLAVVWGGTNFAVLAAAFLAFGLAAGSGYYASIYYSLHGHDDQAAKSGLHESVLNGGALVAISIAGGAPYLVGGGFAASPHSAFLLTAAFFAAGFCAMAAFYVFSRRGAAIPSSGPGSEAPG
jgi:MFS family permease